MAAPFLKSKASWVLGGILLLAALLRFWALDFGLPNTSRPDEDYISYTALYRILNHAMTGQGDFHPHFFEYPTFFIHLVAGAYALFFWFGTWTGVFPDFTAFLHRYADDITAFHLISRGLSAFMGTVTVWIVYKIAKRLLPEPEDFPKIAAFLMAITYLHVRDSHFGVTDVPMTFWVSLSLLFSLKYYQEPPSGKNLLWASSFIGWAAATKYPGILAIVPMGMALILKPQQPLRQRLQAISLAGLGIFAAFFIAAPYVVLDFPAAYQALAPLAKHLAQGHGGIGQALGWDHHLSFTLFYGLGALYEGAAIIGLAYLLLIQRSKPWWILGSFALAYYGVMGASKAVFVRYMLPLLPVLALAAAWSILQLSVWIQDRLRLKLSPHQTALAQTGLVIALTGCVGLQSLAASLWFNRCLAQPDTRTLARNWILQHNPPQTPIVIGLWPGAVVLPYRQSKFLINPATFQKAGLSPQTALSDQFYIQPVRWLHLNLIPNYQAAIALQSLGVRYIVANTYPPLALYSPPVTDWQLLHQMAPVALQFNPFQTTDHPTACLYDTQDGFFLPFAPCASVLRPGPQIDIMALPAPEAQQR